MDSFGLFGASIDVDYGPNRTKRYSLHSDFLILWEVKSFSIFSCTPSNFHECDATSVSNRLQVHLSFAVSSVFVDEFAASIFDSLHC